MKFHLVHLAAVTDITPILAVRALWTWEGDFSSSDHEPALTVAEIDDKGSTLQSKGLYVAGSDEPCLVARHTGDNISLLSSGAVPACVAEVLAAIGLGRKAVQQGGDTLLYGGDSETLWERVLCIDTAWILMRKLLRLGTDSMSIGIKHLTEHLRTHAKDFHSRRGLIAMTSRRRKLLDYRKRNELPKYDEMVKRLGLRR